MVGGLRLLFSLISLLFPMAVVHASDSSTSTTALPGPPRAAVNPVDETMHGTRIVDDYRWLEDASSPETQRWVSEEGAYSRSLLDPLPGREQLHKRLGELLSIGTISAPQIGGPHYFYTRREGTQNQPVLLVREGLHGEDRTLVDVNQMASDGTVALDWWAPSEDGKYVAYGTSPSGSEDSTLHIVETAGGELLSDTIPR